MKKILLILVISILLFGCFGIGGQTPPQNVTNNSVVNTTNTTHITIIIGKQKNETIVGPAPDNQTVQPSLPEYENAPQKSMGIYFMDVATSTEHGNAILIKKGGFNVLVDAGPADTIANTINFLKAHGVYDISILISTNADSRNYGGINSLADNFPIQSFWWNGEDFNDSSYSATVQKVRGVAKEVKIVGQGDEFFIDGIDFKVLNPPAVKFSDLNNDALVLKVTNGDFSTLITSQIQGGAQNKLVNEQKDAIASNVLEAPYYGTGAGTSGINLFLLTVKPKEIVMTGSIDDSVVNGNSRQPFRNILKEYMIPYYQTFTNGTIRITNDGSSVFGIQNISS